MTEQKNIKGKNLINALALVIIIVLAGYLVSRNLSKSISVIIAFVGLGVVIFIHELGHFVSAKLCGIKAEAFAIGFGTLIVGVKKIENYLQIRILPAIFEKENDEEKTGLLCVRIPMTGSAGETEYQIRIFPVGGFVKLTGQEDLGSDKPSDDPRSFVNVPIWKRIVTVSAGVTLNVVLAAIFFIIVFMRGINLPPAIIGGVMPGYPAAKAGLKAGDEIIAINGRDKVDFEGVAFAAALAGKGKAVAMTVRKTDGTIVDINLVPTPINEIGIKGFGIEPPSTLEIAKVDKPQIIEEQFGLKAGDVLTTINGEQIEHFWQFSEKLQSSFKPNVTLGFKRQGQNELIETEIAVQYSPAVVYRENGEFEPSHIYGLMPRLRIESIQLKEANDVLRVGDVILQINETANPSYRDLREHTQASAGKEMRILVLRNGRNVEVKITPKKGRDGRAVIGIIPVLDVNSTIAAQTVDVNNYRWPKDFAGNEILSIAGQDVRNYFDIARVLNENRGKTVTVKYKGILDNEEISFAVPKGENHIKVVPQLTKIPPFRMLRKLYRASGAAEAIKMGSRKTAEFVGQTYMTIKGLITRQVSPKSLMGPVGLIAMSTKIISDKDFMYYLYFMGMISACLAVMNFLPLPIFDGGLVVLLLIEKIKGSPVHAKVQEALVYIGLVFILGLVIMITYNDILRWFFDK